MNRASATPPVTTSRKQVSPNTHPTNGFSINGSAPKDAASKAALTELTRRLARLWNPNCDVQNGNRVDVVILFTLSSNGRVIQGPDWSNANEDAVWIAGANRAKAAVMQGQPFTGLPDALYNYPLAIEFDARKACQ